MKNIKEYMKTGDIVQFVKKLFEARQTAHAFHLQSKSYAEHVALDTFYGDLLGLIDEFVEVYQGEYGLIEQPNALEVDKNTQPVSYINDLVATMKKFRKQVSEDDTHLQNIIDEMIALSYKTIYKLKFLK